MTAAFTRTARVPDSISANAGSLFDLAFARRAASLNIAEEDAADQPFLADLFAACSPLRDFLPPAMLQQQAAAQRESHRAEHPDATGRIVLSDSQPVARILIDWSRPLVSRCVDIGVLPEYQSRGIATALLLGWIEVADSRDQLCTLAVLRDTPADRLYRKLGFMPTEDDDEISPSVEMARKSSTPLS